ncbi:MAG: hypothetical protein DWH81_12375 [Planctomycetota bacterium]|nr:MAG: hypothetical protein DWH81_12375 [Planctomycetota bacterium]
MKRILTSSILALAVLSSLATVALACPMCKYANEADQHDEAANRRPKAFMYSILFMLSMPPTIFTVFGISFYRLNKQAQAAAALENEATTKTP